MAGGMTMQMQVRPSLTMALAAVAVLASVFSTCQQRSMDRKLAAIDSTAIAQAASLTHVIRFTRSAEARINGVLAMDSVFLARRLEIVRRDTEARRLAARAEAQPVLDARPAVCETCRKALLATEDALTEARQLAAIDSTRADNLHHELVNAQDGLTRANDALYAARADFQRIAKLVPHSGSREPRLAIIGEVRRGLDRAPLTGMVAVQVRIRSGIQGFVGYEQPLEQGLARQVIVGARATLRLF